MLLNDFLTLAIMPGSSIVLSNDERVRIFTAAAPHGDVALNVILDFTEDNLNIINVINRAAFNSILSSVASRVGSQQLHDRFVEVMTKILSIDGITQTNFDSHQTNAKANLNWQAENAEAIEEFFYNLNQPEETTKKSGASGMIVSTILLIACLVLKNIL